MSIPKSVNILGRKSKISTKFKKGTSQELKSIMARDYDGLFHGSSGEIWINPRQDLECQWRTLFHEIGHGVMYRNGLRFSDLVDERVEEVIVETFANVYFELFDSMYPNFWKDEE
jgi:Zn-dependent peptidase ImmA (M78 family)